MDIRAILMGIAFAAMWASAFASARIIVAEAPPLTALAVRFFISGGLAVMIALILGQSWRLTRTQWIATAVFGLCQNALYLGLNFVAMQTVEASLAAIIASTMPLLVALAGFAVFGERVRPLGAIGLCAGVVGVAIIMSARLTSGIDLFGLVLCVIGVVSLTVATMSVRVASSGGNLLMIVGLQMFVGAASLAVAAAFTESWAQVAAISWSWQFGAAFAYTTVVPGLIATWVWFLLVERIGAVKAATFHFLTPPFGVAVAATILGERMGWLDAVGVGVVALGILAVQLSKQR